jgi:hypothetical protein
MISPRQVSALQKPSHEMIQQSQNNGDESNLRV